MQRIVIVYVVLGFWFSGEAQELKAMDHTCKVSPQDILRDEQMHPCNPETTSSL